MSSSIHSRKNKAKHWRLKQTQVTVRYRLCLLLMSGITDKNSRRDCVFVSCLWPGSRIRRWVSGLCGGVTTHHSCTSSVWQPLMEELGYWKACVLAHPALSVWSNHRPISLCHVAVCAAGFGVLMKTQEEIRGSWQMQLAACHLTV